MLLLRLLILGIRRGDLDDNVGWLSDNFSLEAFLRISGVGHSAAEIQVKSLANVEPISKSHKLT